MWFSGALPSYLGLASASLSSNLSSESGEFNYKYLPLPMYFLPPSFSLSPPLFSNRFPLLSLPCLRPLPSVPIVSSFHAHRPHTPFISLISRSYAVLPSRFHAHPKTSCSYCRLTRFPRSHMHACMHEFIRSCSLPLAIASSKFQVPSSSFQSRSRRSLCRQCHPTFRSTCP
jgi:hypothetical protein